MKAISLWQPWASAIAVLLKRNETRGWATKYRGPIAIHAAKRWQADQRVFAELAREQDARLPAELPFGAIVAVAWLEDCLPTMQVLPTVGALERLYGNYQPGRYAWPLRDIVALERPVPYRGAQGFFEVPDILLMDQAPASAWRATLGLTA